MIDKPKIIKNMKKTLFYLALAAIAACSCNRSKNDSGAPGQILFTAPFSASVDTKTSEVDATALQSGGFNVSAVKGSGGSDTEAWTNVHFTNDGNVYTGGKWWPISDPSYRFYASNSALSFTQGGATVSASNDKDIVCAYASSPIYKATNQLRFRHIFARLSDVTVSAIDGYTITGVSMSIVPIVSGTYNLYLGDGHTIDRYGWSDTQEGSAVSIADSTPGTRENDIYLAPGNYIITATWTATKGDYSETFSNYIVTVVLTSGKMNNINCSLGGDAESISFKVSVAPWTETNINVDSLESLVDPRTMGVPCVDIGLREEIDGVTYKVIFADRNLGADEIEDYGEYFGWGCYNYYNWYCLDGYNATDGLTELTPEDDPARMELGGQWRTPTLSEAELLMSSEVFHDWVENYNGTDVNGFLVSGKGSYAYASVFFPAAGGCDGTDCPEEENVECYYWTRTLYTRDNNYQDAYAMTFDEDGYDYGTYERNSGFSIRPVVLIPE